MNVGGIHHIEIWVPSLQRASETWGWLLEALGYVECQTWPAGRSWKLRETYIVLEESPDTSGPHERTSAGLNHLAFHAGSRTDVDRLTEGALDHGWKLLFADLHPHAGGPDHAASYLENDDGFEIELVADTAEQFVDGGD